jgi:transcriptional regulator with XRE-family HTH domain
MPQFATAHPEERLANSHRCGILNFQEVADEDNERCAANMKTFGEVIAELRKERGLTQKALAAQVKKKDGTAIGLAYINDIEHDRRGPPAPDFVAQLAEVLEVPLDVLQFYAGRLPAEGRRERQDPSHDRIVAAYRAFRRELDKKRGD